VHSARAAYPDLEPGASIIVTASVQAYNPSPGLIDYAMTKAAQVAFVQALAEEAGPRGIRVNAVAPGPIWTPLIPATGWDAERLATFGRTLRSDARDSRRSSPGATCTSPRRVLVHLRIGHRRHGRQAL
jgi:NAD(P)-dependent dehydrogenase (short-subunit alcohol dehydrogenase family)